MASPGVALLKQGVNSFNEWRKEKDGRSLDLSAADLTGRDLTGIDLRGVNLSNAILRGAKLGPGSLLWNANLSGADLYGANLRGADLQDVNFSGADLFQADLRETNLQGADLSTAKGGLLSKQLAGSDLTGAKLPEPLAKLYDGLTQVKEISDSAQKLFLALLAGCLYSWLTIAQTTDVELITNRATTPLPIIQAAIPIVGFYVVAPLILLCLYFYFHFYLQKLWEELGSLPAIFADGRELHKRTDPWLLNDLVRSHLIKLKIGRPFLSHFQAWVSVVLAWWLVPVTLFLFWGRYLRRHDLFWTVFHVLLLTTSIIAALRLYRLANRTLRGQERTTFLLTSVLRRPSTYLRIISATALSAFLIAVSYGAIVGDLPGIADSPRNWVPWAMDSLGYSPFANLTNADVSIKPAIWTGKKDEELDLVKGAVLPESDLRHASASGAFLAKANLDHAQMEGSLLGLADLRYTNLTSAMLDGANLKEALLQFANARYASLRYAELRGAHLDHADLQFADLKGASLNEAHFTGATLRDANISDAILWHTDLSNADLASSHLDRAHLLGVDLSGAKLYASIKYADFRAVDIPNRGLTADMIKVCENWQLAFYDHDMLKQLGLPPDHNEKLQKQMEAEEQAKTAAATPAAPNQEP